jgi:CRP-like cAMP-binding protein/chemotaxis methyl-accepting protein methylase
MGQSLLSEHLTASHIFNPPLSIIPLALPYARLLQCQVNEAVMMKGETARCFYYVHKGALEVSYREDEIQITVALIGAGNFFGEVGFFEGMSRVRDIRATKPSDIYIFDQASILKLLQENPILYSQLITIVTQSICSKFKRILDEREPLMGYAASLSTGKRSYKTSQPLPPAIYPKRSWKNTHKAVEEFKAQMFDISHQLQQEKNADIPDGLRNRGLGVLNTFNTYLSLFNPPQDEAEDANYIWGYVFKEFFPYLMRSRFAERTYYKPKGFAGDFKMIEMIYKNVPQGDGKLGQLIDDWLLNSTAARAVRGRRRLLAEKLDQLSRQRYNNGKPVRIMNLACGSCRELFDFIKHFEYAQAIEATCIDIDSQALQHTHKHVNVFPHQASIRLMQENLVKWSLGRARQSFELQDIIYSSGLMDYLDRKLFTALVTQSYRQLKAGGALIIGNFGPENPDRNCMDHILQWKLIHRSPDDLRELFSGSPFGPDIDVIQEEEGVNLFALAVKA